jgi:hypothetical protein
MQSSEYLRRKVQAMPKVIMSPKQVDSSTYIWGKTVHATMLKGCCPAPQTFPINIPCTTLPIDVGTASPEDSYLGIKPAAYYSNVCPKNSGAPPQLASKRCNCLTPGNHNTLWANNVPVILGPTEYAAYKSCKVCSGSVSMGCDENGFGC